MSILGRISTLSDEPVVDGEFSNIVNTINNLDSGIFTWDNVNSKAGTFTNLTITNFTVSGNIAMGGFKLTGLGAGTSNGDSLRYEQLIGLYLLLTGGTMSGPIAMGSNKITGLTNGSAAQDAAAYGQLKVLQTVLGTATSNFTTTSSSFQTTNLTASITPTSSSNRVLIIANGILIPTTTSYVLASLFRGSTNLSGGSNNSFIQATSTVTDVVPASLSYIDSPATTSSTTYSVKICNQDNSSTVQWGNGSQQSMILMEIV